MSARRPDSALERLRQLGSVRGATPTGGPDAPPPTPGTSRGGLTGLVAVALLLLWKSKALLVFLLGKAKLVLGGLQLLKLGKLFTTGWTMLLSMWVYSTYFGAPFAVGFVLLVLVHELGHGLAARLVGLPVGAPVFIPFFGAMIALKELPRTTFQDFVVGAGGPLAGTAGGLLCLGASRVTDGPTSQLLHVLAYFTLVVNLFNLLPVWQLDGARMTAPLRPGHWAVAVGVAAVATFWASGATGELNPLALVVVLVAAYRGVRCWWTRRAERDDDGGGGALDRLARLGRRDRETRELEVGARERWVACAVWTGLAALLVGTVHALHVTLPDVG